MSEAMSKEVFKELIHEANKLTDKDILILDLESQIEEAREEIQDLKNIGNMFKCFVPANITDLYNEQLKEQG